MTVTITLLSETEWEFDNVLSMSVKEEYVYLYLLKKTVQIRRDEILAIETDF